MLKLCSIEEWALSLRNLPPQGMMQNGVLYELPTLGFHTFGRESGLLPTPTATDWKGVPLSRYKGSEKYRGGRLVEALRTGPESGTLPHPEFLEEIMGYPITWTELIL